MAEARPLTPVAPIAAATGREAGAGYAAVARALSAVPALAPRDGPADAAALPGLDAAALAAAGIAPLLPGGAGVASPSALPLALPLALGLLRPDARRWLGPERLAALAAALGLGEVELGVLLDVPPVPPAALGEPARWNGRQLPLLAGGALAWLQVFWRPDRPPPGARRGVRNPDRIALALRVTLPATGRLELRARLEEDRLDAVIETARGLPRATTAEMAEAFAAALARLGLRGELTLRHTEQTLGT